jgi:hypothetical protein
MSSGGRSLSFEICGKGRETERQSSPPTMSPWSLDRRAYRTAVCGTRAMIPCFNGNGGDIQSQAALVTFLAATSQVNFV